VRNGALQKCTSLHLPIHRLERSCQAATTVPRGCGTSLAAGHQAHLPPAVWTPSTAWRSVRTAISWPRAARMCPCGWPASESSPPAMSLWPRRELGTWPVRSLSVGANAPRCRQAVLTTVHGARRERVVGAAAAGGTGQSFEMINERVPAGVRRIWANDAVRACDHWLAVWKGYKPHLGPEMTRVRDLGALFHRSEYFYKPVSGVRERVRQCRCPRPALPARVHSVSERFAGAAQRRR
jgi:hypothetical protein